MRTSTISAAAAALLAGLGAFSAATFAEEAVQGSEIPTNAYYGDKLTPTERSGIQSEESITPDDGKASVPDPQDQGIIPDAADAEKGDTTVTAPASGDLPGDVPQKGKAPSNEAEVIIQESRKNFRVTENELQKCIEQWDAQTQMTKEEWARSCRTTLQYYPDTGN